jgi:hypothetical protein
MVAALTANSVPPFASAAREAFPAIRHLTACRR